MTALAAPSPPPALQLLEIQRVLLRLCALAVGRKSDLFGLLLRGLNSVS